MQIIDAHHHFWDLDRNYLPWLKDEPPIGFRYGDYSTLKKNYLPEDYRRDTGRFDVVGSVYIETEFDPDDPLGEMSWLGEVRSAHGLPTVAVAQAWLDRPDAAEVLAAHGATSFVRGIRHKPTAVAQPDQASRGASGSMDDPRWREGFALLEGNGLSFDLQTPWWHLDAAADLAHDFPGTQIILNHTGLPADRSEEGLANWQVAIGKLAEHDNVAIKVSGLGIPHRPWTVEDNRPVVLAAIECFGVDRVMFASNFPVDSLVADFETIFDGFDMITRGFDENARSAMFRENARRIYRMDA